MAVHTFNPSTEHAEAGGSLFTASPDYLVRACLKKKRHKSKNKWWECDHHVRSQAMETESHSLLCSSSSRGKRTGRVEKSGEANKRSLGSCLLPFSFSGRKSGSKSPREKIKAS